VGDEKGVGGIYEYGYVYIAGQVRWIKEYSSQKREREREGMMN